MQPSRTSAQFGPDTANSNCGAISVVRQVRGSQTDLTSHKTEDAGLNPNPSVTPSLLLSTSRRSSWIQHRALSAQRAGRQHPHALLPDARVGPAAEVRPALPLIQLIWVGLGALSPAASAAPRRGPAAAVPHAARRASPCWLGPQPGTTTAWSAGAAS